LDTSVNAYSDGQDRDNSLYQSFSEAEAKILDKKEEDEFLTVKLEDFNTNNELLRLYEEVEALKTKVVFTKQNTLSIKNPRKRKKVEAITYYNYRLGSIYELHAGVDRVTDITLEQGEVLTSKPVAGDTVRWNIGKIESVFCFVKTTFVFRASTSS
jgi:type IV secretory pathway VirB9-like protein